MHCLDYTFGKLYYSYFYASVYYMCILKYTDNSTVITVMTNTMTTLNGYYSSLARTLLYMSPPTGTLVRT